MPSGGGVTPNAISLAMADVTEWTPPQTPHARLVMKMASRGSRPSMITSYPRKSVAIDRASMTFPAWRSATAWNASAPATRVTGSKSTFLMYPLRARSSSILSREGGRSVLTRTSRPVPNGSDSPGRSRGLPWASNSMGRFLKHMRLAFLSWPSASKDARDAEQVAVHDAERGEQLTERGVDRLQAITERRYLAGDGLEPARELGDVAARADEGGGDGD